MANHALEALQSEVQIIHLLYHRNRNQHRQAKWWKYFSILHRRCMQLAHTPSTTEQTSAVATYLVDKICPVAYRYFHGVLAQGSFVSLGIALVACLAKLRSLLVPLIQRKQLRLLNEPLTTSTMQIDDVGETVERPLEAVALEAVAALPSTSSDVDTTKTTKKSKIKNPKKSRKSAIDDIFGTRTTAK
jgi:ribonuclease MRP protein subunit RMP1